MTRPPVRNAPSAGEPGARTERSRLIIAMTGATGIVYGVRLLEMLSERADVETHLLVSSAGWLSAAQEIDRDRRSIESLAAAVHDVRDVGASIASGSYQTMGMIVAPCSMRTLAAVAIGLSDNLITRAADVTLKERRRLVLLARETPLNLAHLRNMTTVTEMGGIVFPPLPAFYMKPQSIEQMIDQTCVRVLDLFGLAPSSAERWEGRVRPARGDGATQGD